MYGCGTMIGVAPGTVPRGTLFPVTEKDAGIRTYRHPG
jgi:hypothetical protein